VRRGVRLIFGLALAAASVAAPSQAAPRTIDARYLHRSALVIDLHADTVQDLAAGTRTLGARSRRGHLDLPRMRDGGIDVQVFAVYVAPRDAGVGGARAGRLIDVIKRELDSNAGGIALATTTADIERARRAGAVAAVLSIENGDALEGHLDAVDTFHAAGVRMLSLTWNASNALGDGALGSTHGGLTDLGRMVLRRMNQIGMVVDVSHLSEASFWDALAVTRGPLLASHANAASVHAHSRNLTDRQLRAIARRSGVVGVAFVPQFLGASTLARVLDHVDHMVAVMGIDYVALGSDFDGFRRAPAGLDDATKLPNLTAGLLARGYQPTAIRKILGENALRVFRTVWKP
jgi:membrane dipeptidase